VTEITEANVLETVAALRALQDTMIKVTPPAGIGGYDWISSCGSLQHWVDMHVGSAGEKQRRAITTADGFGAAVSVTEAHHRSYRVYKMDDMNLLGTTGFTRSTPAGNITVTRYRFTLPAALNQAELASQGAIVFTTCPLAFIAEEPILNNTGEIRLWRHDDVFTNRFGTDTSQVYVIFFERNAYTDETDLVIP